MSKPQRGRTVSQSKNRQTAFVAIQLIDKLGGPKAVAEMTGRKGRIVKGVFELRAKPDSSEMDSLNVREAGEQYLAYLPGSLYTFVESHCVFGIFQVSSDTSLVHSQSCMLQCCILPLCLFQTGTCKDCSDYSQLHGGKLREM